MLGVVRYCNSSSLADLGMVARTLVALPCWIAMLIRWRKNDVALVSCIFLTNSGLILILKIKVSDTIQF